MFVRFSTVAGNKGSFDLARDVRGFAVKFYTQEGNWDLVGNNIPVFFIQDAIKFPDVVHAVKQEPDRGFPQAQSAHDNFWDFISLMPEATHMVMWTMSDRAIPRSFRFMEGFGVHTFRLRQRRRRVDVRQVPLEAEARACSRWCGTRRSRSTAPIPTSTGATCGTRSTAATSRSGSSACSCSTTTSPTASTSTSSTPPRSSPRSWCRSAGSAGWCSTGRSTTSSPRPSRSRSARRTSCPGIDFTNDPLLQGRNFSYLDTQLKRLGGPNFTHLPVNAPKCPVAHFQQDGHMAMTNPVGRVNYEPNSWSGAAPGRARTRSAASSSFPEPVDGVKQRVRSERFADHYSQARQFYVSQTPVEQTHIVDAFVFELSKCEQPGIRARMVANLRNVDEDFARQVADGLRLAAYPEPSAPARPPITDLPPSPALSILAQRPGELRRPQDRRARHRRHRRRRCSTRSRKAATAEGALVELIAPQIGGVVTERRQRSLPAHQKIDGGPSVLYDAVAVLASAEGAALLAADAGGQGLRHRRPRPLQVRRLHVQRAGAVRCRRAHPADGRRLHADRHQGIGHGLHRGVPRAALLGAHSGVDPI